MAESEGSKRTKRKALPESVSSLLEVAIFSFCCQAGVRSNHKIRGDPIIEGICCFFGRLLTCSSPETLDEFNQKETETRLGGWKPGQSPSKELMTLVSSRLKHLKADNVFSEKSRPSVPMQLLHKEQEMTEDERLLTEHHPKCWRCGDLCEFCKEKSEMFPKFGSFRTDTTTPFLEVLDKMLEEEEEEEADENELEEDEPEETTEETEFSYKEFMEENYQEDDDDDGEFLLNKD